MLFAQSRTPLSPRGCWSLWSRRAFTPRAKANTHCGKVDSTCQIDRQICRSQCMTEKRRGKHKIDLIVDFWLITHANESTGGWWFKISTLCFLIVLVWIGFSNIELVGLIRVKTLSLKKLRSACGLSNGSSIRSPENHEIHKFPQNFRRTTKKKKNGPPRDKESK